MMKKIFIFLILMLFATTSVYAKTDKTSAEYLQNKKHFSILNPFVEATVEKIIKKSLKKSTGENFKVKFDGYTLHSMKKGIFKNLELQGKDFQINDIDVKYLKLKSLTNYNKIDYNKKPIAIETDMVYAYEIHLTEQSINQALNSKEYKKSLEKINNKVYPLFSLYETYVQIKNNKLRITMEYNFPIAPSRKNKKVTITTGVKLERNKISADDILIDSNYNAVPAEQVAKLINLLDPLTFTLDLMNTTKCNARTENVKIIDNIIQINGKIYVKGSGK